VQVTREVTLEACVDEVWRALTERERLTAWFANEVELDLRPGGTGEFRWADGTSREAVVEAVEESALLVFRWREGPDDESRVEIELAETDRGTSVRVTETALGPRARARLGEWSGAVVLLSLVLGAVALV
jgi:uncharacterized protein YndB with AHSA1/START domain